MHKHMVNALKRDWKNLPLKACGQSYVSEQSNFSLDLDSSLV